ncbi:uncharacterized protein LOC134225852 [Armigeres subalbatus]|uniref:uncharacterized protein LOC134225852 n=1 Tax=Armigeres subalbatus TaxID=124917 RepID=UPI002ED32F2F
MRVDLISKSLLANCKWILLSAFSNELWQFGIRWIHILVIVIMGVRHLDTFVRNDILGSFYWINIEEQIREHFKKSVEPPIIVIDLLTLFEPLGMHDQKGLLFGGRFNLAFVAIDEFFTKLTRLGAELVFFCDGNINGQKKTTWCNRQDNRYEDNLKLIDAIERGTGLRALVNEYRAPLNFRYPLWNVAQKYGKCNMTFGRECDQVLAAHAMQVNALAIISNDSDFLIYKGSWRYWSSACLNLSTLCTIEYNRYAIVDQLGLNFDQMPLFATLMGNDIMPFDSVNYFHKRHGSGVNKFFSMAQYIRTLSYPQLDDNAILNILNEITNNKVDEDLIQKFHRSLDTYSVKIQPLNLNPTADPLIGALVRRDSPFEYLIWKGEPLDVSIYIADMRRNDFGNDYAKLLVGLISRMAGIILFQRKPRPKQLRIAIKTSHREPHRVHTFTVKYPRNIDTPTLLHLLSKEQSTQEMLRDIKFQLLSWTASDTLNPDELQKIPSHFRITAMTLYYLLERHLLKLFEADLFLQVAYDVSFQTYDIMAVEYPETIMSRPFLLAFFYQQIYKYMTHAIRVVGLDDEDNFRDGPLFDGVLFHQRYDEWSQGQYRVDHIKEWRIYAGLTSHLG